MTDDRASRMASRLNRSDDEPEPEPEQSAEPEAPQAAPQEDEQEDEQENDRTKNITDNPTIQIYDVEGLRDEVDDLFRDLEYVHERALDQDFGKHTDFYPALLRAGLDQIYDELDIDENDTPRL